MTAACDSSKLRAAATAFLRYEKQCSAISFEGGIVMNNPDVLAVDPSLWLIECEIKTSLSDFKRDMQKAKWNNAHIYASFMPRPRWFYFVVPHSLVEKVKPFLPEGCGLMSPWDDKATLGQSGHLQLICQVKPKANKTARKITVKEFFKMSKHQASTLTRLIGKFELVRHAARIS